MCQCSFLEPRKQPRYGCNCTNNEATTWPVQHVVPKGLYMVDWGSCSALPLGQRHETLPDRSAAQSTSSRKNASRVGLKLSLARNRRSEKGPTAQKKVRARRRKCEWRKPYSKRVCAMAAPGRFLQHASGRALSPNVGPRPVVWPSARCMALGPFGKTCSPTHVRGSAHGCWRTGGGS